MARKLSETPPPTPSETHLTERVAELEQTVESLRIRHTSMPFASFFRQLLIVILIILSVVSLTLAITSLWLKRTVIDTDGWTALSTSLLQNESVRTDIATKVTDQIFTTTDIEQVIKEALPPRLASLAPTLTASVRQQTIDKTSDVLASQQFQTFWKNAMTSAHNGITASLENGGAAPANTDQYIVYINNDKLLLNLKPIIQNAQTKLVDAGLGFVANINTDAVNRTVTLTQIQSLPRILAVFNLIDKSAPVFGIVAIVAGAGALALSHRRQRTVLGIGATVIVTMLVIIQGLRIAQYPFIQQFASLDAVSTTTAVTVYELLVNGLIGLSWLLIWLAVIVLVAALLCGNSRPALAFRQFVNRVAWPKRSSRFISGIAAYKVAIVSVIAAGAALLIVFPPIAGQVFPVVVVVVASLLSLWVYSLESTRRLTA